MTVLCEKVPGKEKEKGHPEECEQVAAAWCVCRIVNLTMKQYDQQHADSFPEIYPRFSWSSYVIGDIGVHGVYGLVTFPLVFCLFSFGGRTVGTYPANC